MPAVVIYNHSKSYTQRHLSLQHARDKSSIFWPKHLHAHKCISGCGVDVKEARSRDFDRRDFDRSRLRYTPVYCAFNKVHINHKREKLFIIKDNKLHICMTVVYPLPRMVEIICILTLTHLISNATIIHICSRSYSFVEKLIIIKNCYLNIKFLYK